ncbi:MAG: hypothetical protein L0332_25440 [Chloroflexi bacterium]|nr:hypothetical protein [Chloroflexota bacterium]MCI0730042.1 hypothetical protein [Chloroflexota bacterium]
MASQESSGHVKAAIIGGICAIIAACIGGVFLILNTLVSNGFIEIEPGVQAGNPDPTATAVVVITATSSESATSKYRFVSLNNVGKFESGNLGLEAGTVTLAEVDFEIGWLATTHSSGDPDNPEMITIDVPRDIRNASKVHFLLQASWAVGQTQEFGSIYLVFADGNTLSEPLIVGYNIRDWSQVNTLLSAPNVQQAWTGSGWDGRTEGVVDILTIDVPSDYRQSAIVQIEIRDESLEKLNSSNPGIHLWAVTMEQ